MSELTIFPRGVPIKSSRSSLKYHKGLEIAVLELTIGDMEICIHFDTHAELITFCDTHNFKYDDER